MSTFSPLVFPIATFGMQDKTLSDNKITCTHCAIKNPSRKGFLRAWSVVYRLRHRKLHHLKFDNMRIKDKT
ncbi:MAG: hypothetical protein CL920_28275 [Deltaproteobacteria bacterium]|nr:hypothetical protein [Deltaproteobacteria bacterium]MBU52611.1 hypothetical protein [Deltaproteobacteria bacterium]